MKRIIALILSAVLLITTFVILSTVSVSAAPGEITEKLRERFADDLVATFEEASDGHIGIPVVLTTFTRSSVDPNGVTLLYVVGHKEERIGTDTDEDIIDDMLNDGYCVTVLDYLDNPLAVGNEFGWSAHKLLCGNFQRGKYTAGYTRKEYNSSYLVPAGCRIEREIYYYSIDEMALNGTNEYILWLWNTYYAGPDGVAKDAQGKDLPSAETIYDMIKKDGSPVDFDLRMDIVYPSNPEKTVPVFAMASSAEERTDSIRSSKRPYFTTALLQGYAAVIYDHEYIPMSRTDHYGYYGNYDLKYSSFTLGYTNANAVHSAVIRRIRYLADTYGYSREHIAVWGFSKSGVGPAVLANTKHEEMGEIWQLTEYCPEGKDPNGYQGEQPWLCYEGTDERISSNVTVAYAGSGNGIGQFRELLMTEDSVPLVSSIGTADTTGGFNTQIPGAKKYFDSHPGIESDFVIAEGLDHNPAFGYDSVKQIEMFNEIWGWLDNHIRAAYEETPPEVLWATPSSNILYDALEEPVVVKFSRAMDVESVKENLKVIRISDGKVVDGTWEVWHGNTTFRFSSPLIINASSYRIVVGKDTKAADGVAMGTEFAKVFTISGDKLLNPSADTYVSSANPDTNYGNEETLKVSNTEAQHNRTFISYQNAGGYKDVTKAILLLDRMENKTGNVSVYGIDSFDENTVTYNTAPENGVLAGGSSVESQITAIDVTDYVKNAQGDTLNFSLETTKEKVFLGYDFEDISASDLVYDTDYRWGGGNAVINISDDAKTGSKSIYVTGRNQNSNRIKFLKSFGTDKLTSEHLGLTVRASFWIKPELDTKVTVSVFEHMALSGVYPEVYDITPGEWNYIEYIITVDQSMIDGNNRAITVAPNMNGNYYLDDFKVELLTGGIDTVSKEYNGDQIKIAPTLVLYTPENSEKTGSVAVIGSGELANTVLGAGASVSGTLEERIDATQKGYIKFPISKFDLNADSINLKFEASSSDKAEFSVYGVLADDSRFAENFTTGITWNTAFANDTETNGVESGKTVLIDSVSVTGTKTVSLNVKDYVTTMADAGYSSVTFIIVKNNENRTVSNVTFENMSSYSAYEKSSTMAVFDTGLTTDPTNKNNRVFFFDKSGENGGIYPGYGQNVCFTGLIQSDDTFDEGDIGKKYKVSFRIYTEAPDATAGNFCNITAAGASTSNNITEGVTRTVSSTATRQWNTVTFDFAVTSDMVKNNTTAILVATGWAVTRVYIDDIVVEESVGDLNITLDDNNENKDIDFEGISRYDDVVKGAGMEDYSYGITLDPADSTNDVFYYDRGAYAHSISFTGLISPTDKFRTSDVGKKITVTYRQYNYCAEEGTSGVLGALLASGANQYFLNTKMTIDRYVNGNLNNEGAGTYGLANNTWHNVRFEVTVTQAMVGLDCALVIASGGSISTIYVDDIVVTVESGEERNVPTLEFTTGTATASSVYTVAAVINGGAADTSYGQQYNVMEIVKTPSGEGNGLKKIYVAFDKSGYYHITGGKLSFNAQGKVGDKILIYAVNKEISVSDLTWNNAYGNDPTSCGIKAGQVYGGEPVAVVTLGEDSAYSADVTAALSEYEKYESIAFIITTEAGTSEIVISDITLNISSAMYAQESLKAEMMSAANHGNVTTLAVDSTYRVDYMVEKVQFFVDGEEMGAPTVNGQVTKVNIKNLAEGEHTAYAVVTYSDGTTVTSDTIDFSVTTEAKPNVVYGDLDDSGDVTTVDLAMMKLYLAGSTQEGKINLVNADMDASGEVTTVDLANLKLFLAGAQV